MKCQHGEVKLLTVKKEGPNKGRQFYACAEPKDSQCDFFEWADSENGGFIEPSRADLEAKVLALISSKLDKVLAEQFAQKGQIEEVLKWVKANTPVNTKVENKTSSSEVPF